jgi:hypothetical protein
MAELFPVLRRVTGSKGSLFDTFRKLVKREVGVSTAGLGRELAVLVRSHADDQELIDVLARTLAGTVERSVEQVVGPDSGQMLTLTGEQKNRLLDGMSDSFFDRYSLEEFAYLSLDRPLDHVARANAPLRGQILDLIRYCEQHGTTASLLSALVRRRETPTELRTLASGLLRGRAANVAELPIDLNDLNGPQKRVLREAIVEAFTAAELKILLSDELDKPLHELSMDMSYDRAVFHLIERAQSEGWSGDLIKALQERRREQPAIRSLVSDLSLLDVEGDRHLENRSLEQTIQARGGFGNLAEWMQKLQRICGNVCRLEDAGTPIGTAFMVGRDLVLTAFHLLEGHIGGTRDWSQLACRFDYAVESTGESPGLIVHLASPGWLVASSLYSSADLGDADVLPLPSELDCALVRLAEPIGERPSPGGNRLRGWLVLPAGVWMPAPNEVISIVQHPMGRPVAITIGAVTGVNTNGTRLRYDANTVAGSSGSPCFDARLNLVAMHHAGRLGAAQLGEGIPIDRIVALLAAQPDVPRFWEESPPT